jgi:hypothetical protein
MKNNRSSSEDPVFGSMSWINKEVQNPLITMDDKHEIYRKSTDVFQNGEAFIRDT